MEPIPTVHRTLEDRNQIAIDIIDEEDDSRDDRKEKRRRTRKGSAPRPRHVRGGDWKDMMKMTASKKRGTVQRARASSSIKSANWIENRLKKVECSRFVPSHKYSNRCGCGATNDQHSDEARKPVNVNGEDEGTTDGGDFRREHAKKWTMARNTAASPTDSYGSILFEGSSHQTRAQFVRASFDTEPESVCHLLEKVWCVPPPKLIITIHGGLTNFDLAPKVARLFRKGIVKAARSTDAWIISTGLNTGVVRHVASALEELGASRSNKTRVVGIGIAPWGMLKARHRFEGKDVNVNYATNQFNKSRLAELNDRHSYFIFADNGTVGRYGAEIMLRKRLETHLARRSAAAHGTAPVVCVILEGGAFTIRVVHDFVTTIPHIPVVVCDGSGRAADMLAYAHRNISEDGKISESAKAQLVSMLENVFSYDRKNTNRVLRQLHECSKAKNLLTVFRLGEAQRQDVDYAILTALLKGKNLSPTEQLRLALAWNRADIARSEIFTMGTDWTTTDLHAAMLEALCHDRTDFVQLLLENGVSMHRFLTYGRLEVLYNTEFGPHHTLRSVMDIGSKKHRIKLTEVGHAMENLMGNAYKSNYTKEDFKAKYFVFSNRKQLNHAQKERQARKREKSENLGNELKIDLLKTARHSIVSILGGGKRDKNEEEEGSIDEDNSLDFTFRYPYSELLIWAVLTKRQEMAMLMWRHGEEALAKALVACRLYAQLFQDASSNFLELEICEEIEKYSEEFRQLSIEILQYTSGQDSEQTLQLLTYELTNWGNETCLSLAALDGNRKFLAHPSCQLLLSDLWHGGLRIRNSSNIKVLSCILVPPGVFLLGFKSKEELKLQPHTAAEHHEADWESDTSEGTDSDFSESETSDSDDEETQRKRASTDTGQVLSFQQLMRNNLPFRGDKVAPVGNGTVANGSNETKPRSRTITSMKKRRTIKGTETETETEDTVPRRKSTQRRMEVQRMDGDGEEKQNALSWRQKLTEFYSAPITTFWMWSVAFSVFMVALIYVLLVETPRRPSWVEWYVFSYVVVWSLEVIRKVVMTIMVDTKAPVYRKLRIFFFSYRNGLLAFALSTYLIAFFIRLNPSTRDWGRVLLASNSVLFVLKLVDYLSVHRQLGPYISMASEMIPRMLPILCMLFVALLGFGLVRQSITFPYEDWHWLLIRNIFYKPYFMLYGEVYAPEIDTCGDEVWDTHIEEGIPISSLNVTHETCVPGYFVVPLFMTVFMIIANVLLMNTMVACCTYVFERNVEITQEIWLFERYRQVMEYESTPFLPPPLTVIYHIYWVVKWLLVKEHFVDRRHLLDASLKLFLSEEEVERIHSFEEESVEDMEREKDNQRQSSNDQRILRTAERSELILNRVNVMAGSDKMLKKDVLDLEQRLDDLQQKEKDKMEYLRLLNSKIELLLQLAGGSGLPLPTNFSEPTRAVSQIPTVPSITIDFAEDEGSSKGKNRSDRDESEEDYEEMEQRPQRRRRADGFNADRLDRYYVDGPPGDSTIENENFLSEDSDSNTRRRRSQEPSSSKKKHC